MHKIYASLENVAKTCYILGWSNYIIEKIGTQWAIMSKQDWEIGENVLQKDLEWVDQWGQDETEHNYDEKSLWILEPGWARVIKRKYEDYQNIEK